MNDLSLCVKAKDAVEEQAITDPSLSKGNVKRR